MIHVPKSELSELTIALVIQAKLNSFPSLEEYTAPKITAIFNMILYYS